jgi:hypothetical protein
MLSPAYSTDPIIQPELKLLLILCNVNGNGIELMLWDLIDIAVVQ